MSNLMRVIVFFSGSASSWRYLRDNDPNYGITYEVVAAFCDDDEASAIEGLQKAGIPVYVCDFKKWRRRTQVKLWDLRARERYFATPLESLLSYEPDLVILSGFMRILPPSVLSAFPNRILNVHPADARIRDEEGKIKYGGDDAVTLAINDGVIETRSSILVVTQEVDNGPILVVSAPLPVIPGRDPKEHQDEMKTKCDGPAYMFALNAMVTYFQMDPEKRLLPSEPIVIHYLSPTS